MIVLEERGQEMCRLFEDRYSLKLLKAESYSFQDLFEYAALKEELNIDQSLSRKVDRSVARLDDREVDG
jgi:hypothetical protein